MDQKLFEDDIRRALKGALKANILTHLTKSVGYRIPFFDTLQGTIQNWSRSIPPDAIYVSPQVNPARLVLAIEALALSRKVSRSFFRETAYSIINDVRPQIQKLCQPSVANLLFNH